MKKYLALKASAGSGKTFALTVRYISLLLLGAKPNEILTLTFTNKAANEIIPLNYEIISKDYVDFTSSKIEDYFHFEVDAVI